MAHGERDIEAQGERYVYVCIHILMTVLAGQSERDNSMTTLKVQFDKFLRSMVRRIDPHTAREILANTLLYY